VSILSLTVLPAIIGQSYSPAKFACPAGAVITNSFCWSFRLPKRSSTRSTTRDDKSNGSRRTAGSLRVRLAVRAWINAACVGAKFAYTGVDRLLHIRGSGVDCAAGATVGDRKPRGRQFTVATENIHLAP
jgi:hypothetical protein